MTITKKLFFITILCSILGSFTTNCTVNSWQLHDQNIFDFAMTLSKQENNDAKEIARWLTAQVALNARGDNNFNVHTINLIINSPLTLGEKIEQLKQIEPSFIRKARTLSLFGINTALSICEGLSMAAKAAAIMAIPALIIFSAEMGAQLAENFCRKNIGHKTLLFRSMNY